MPKTLLEWFNIAQGSRGFNYGIPSTSMQKVLYSKEEVMQIIKNLTIEDVIGVQRGWKRDFETKD